MISFLLPKLSVSMTDLEDRIRQRQQSIDVTQRVAEQQLQQLDQEIEKRIDMADPGITFRKAEQEWLRRRLSGGDRVVS